MWNINCPACGSANLEQRICFTQNGNMRIHPITREPVFSTRRENPIHLIGEPWMQCKDCGYELTKVDLKRQREEKEENTG